MGCRLPKLRKAEEKRSPGNIYSTLRRPQVETKVGVAYTYHFLDFLLGKEGMNNSPILEKSNLRWAGHRLETDVCVASQQAADPEMIQNYVKKIQDVAEQGVMFVGFLQQPGSGPYFLGHWDPEELSSLHSSPSPIHRHPFSANTSPTDPTEPNSNDAEADFCCCESQDVDRGVVECNASVSGGLKRAQSLALSPEEDHIETSQKDVRKSTNGLQNHVKPDADKVKNITDARGNQFNVKPPGTAGTLCKLAEDKHFTGSAEKHSNFSHQREKRGSSSDSWLSSPELGDGKLDSNRVTTHNNNHIRLKKSGKDKGATSPPAQASKYAKPRLFYPVYFSLVNFPVLYL
ncbi:raftlin [Nematolebias whitei]|uniref:raftlin n=1 Tax=Nematolebias whitei TaxID=451745 RepID=UPI001898B02E|nr:raftlin [Nematolebias whitei]